MMPWLSSTLYDLSADHNSKMATMADLSLTLDHMAKHVICFSIYQTNTMQVWSYDGCVQNMIVLVSFIQDGRHGGC